MVSPVAIVVGLILLVVAVILGLIGYDLILLGFASLRDAHAALRGRDTGLQSGYVRTTATVVDGPARTGPLGTSGSIQRVRITQRDWTNALSRTNGVSEAIYDELMYDGTTLEDDDIKRTIISEPTARKDYETPTVEFIKPDWSRTARIKSLEDLSDSVRTFVSDNHIEGGSLRDEVGAFESVQIRERSVETGERIRIVGRFAGTTEGVVPDGKVVFSDASWRRLALTLSVKASGYLLLGGVLTIAALAIVGGVLVEPLVSMALL